MGFFSSKKNKQLSRAVEQPVHIRKQNRGGGRALTDLPKNSKKLHGQAEEEEDERRRIGKQTALQHDQQHPRRSSPASPPHPHPYDSHHSRRRGIQEHDPYGCSTAADGESSTYTDGVFLTPPPQVQRLTRLRAPPQLSKSHTNQASNDSNNNDNNTGMAPFKKQKKKKKKNTSMSNSVKDLQVDNSTRSSSRRREEKKKKSSFAARMSASTSTKPRNKNVELVCEIVTNPETARSVSPLSYQSMKSRMPQEEEEESLIEEKPQKHEPKKEQHNNSKPPTFAWRISTSCVALSMLDHSASRNNNSDKVPMMNRSMFEPAPERMVRESCIRHLQLLCPGPVSSSSERQFVNDTDYTFSADDDDDDASGPVDVDAYQRYRNKDTSSMIAHDVGKAEQLVREFIQARNYDGAIAIHKELLHRHRNEHFTVISMLARRLALLCLAGGRCREATKYSMKGIRALQSKRKTTREEAEAALYVLLVHGLACFATHKVSQAFKAWREATHMAIAVNGYQDTTVAVLLNCIGVLHFETGDLKSSLRTLEESLELQRTILSSIITSDDDEEKDNKDKYDDDEATVGHAIYRMATTMSNLAMVCERKKHYDRAIGLLDESIALYESNQADTSDIEELLQLKIDHMLEEAQCEEEEGLAGAPTRSSMDEGYDDDDDDDVDDNEDQEMNGRFHSGSSCHGPESYLTEDESCSDFHEREKDYDDNNEDDGSSVDSERSMTLFGHKDGIPNRRIAAKLTMEQSDNHDFLLLGRLSPELTMEQRVRETILTWFGKRIDDDPVVVFDLQKGRSGASGTEKSGRLPFSPSSPSPKRKHQRSKESLRVDLDESKVVNADLHLNEIHKQAMAHLDSNEIDDALDLFKSALRSHRKKYGNVHHLVGSALHNIGMVHFFAKQYTEALSVFEVAVDVRTKALGPDHPDVQSSLVKIALIQLALGDLNKAHDVFWQVRNKLLGVLGYGHPLLAKIFNNIGIVAYEFGDLKNALRSFEIAYEYQRRLLEQQQQQDTNNSNASNSIVSLATVYSLCNMAFVYSKSGEDADALDVYEHALKILRKYAPPNDHHLLVQIHENIQHLLSTNPRLAVAFNNHQQQEQAIYEPDEEDGEQAGDDVNLSQEITSTRRLSYALCQLDLFG